MAAGLTGTPPDCFRCHTVMLGAALTGHDGGVLQVLTKRNLVSDELAATVTKFISENQTHQPGQAAPAPAAAPSPAQPAKR